MTETQRTELMKQVGLGAIILSVIIILILVVQYTFADARHWLNYDNERVITDKVMIQPNVDSTNDVTLKITEEGHIISQPPSTGDIVMDFKGIFLVQTVNNDQLTTNSTTIYTRQEWLTPANSHFLITLQKIGEDDVMFAISSQNGYNMSVKWLRDFSEIVPIDTDMATTFTTLK